MKQDCTIDQDRRLTGVAVVLFVGETMLLAAAGIIGRNQFLVAMTSPLVCFVSLASFWTAHAQTPFPRRIALALLPGAVIGLMLFSGRISLEKQIVGYLAATLSLPMISLPGFALRAVGYRIVRFVDEPAPSPMEIDRRPVQYSLRQMTGLAVVISGLALLGKLLVGDDSLTNDGRAGVAIVATVAISNAAVALASLGRRRPIRATVAVAMTSALIVFVIGHTFASRDSSVNLLAEMTGMSALLTGAALLLLRRQGYRLLRVRKRSAVTSSVDPAPAPVD